MEAKKIDSTVSLNNGVRMPIFGLGVYRSPPGAPTKQAVLDALELGYRLVDTAAAYGNEADVGEAIAESGLRREELFVTTKLWNDDHGHDQALRAFERSRKKLKLDYVDLYLIHWPVEGLREESWRALEDLLEDEQVRAIGVSNFTVRHLERLLERANVVPAINQVEFHPFLYQRELLEFCRSQEIQLEAYSPLTKGMRFDEPKLRAIAEAHGKSPAQILIRWCLDHDVVVIPKSVHRRRIEENSQVFDFALTPAELGALDALSENWRCSWNPTAVP